MENRFYRIGISLVMAERRIGWPWGIQSTLLFPSICTPHQLRSHSKTCWRWHVLKLRFNLKREQTSGMSLLAQCGATRKFVFEIASWIFISEIHTWDYRYVSKRKNTTKLEGCVFKWLSYSRLHNRTLLPSMSWFWISRNNQFKFVLNGICKRNWTFY